jgi:ectoine hydroxylase-related dioxygenase (phytanoyl-CoA dioxygenase family)
MLTDLQVTQYRDRGYTVVENLLTPAQLAELRRVTDEMVAGARGLTASTAIIELEDNHRPDEPRVRRIKNAYHNHPAYEALVKAENVLAPVRQLIGPDIRLHGSKLNIKGARGGAAVEWHQDWAFYPHSNDDVLAIGIFLDDVGMDNAPIMFVPGSHRGPVHDHHSNGAFVGAVDVVAGGIEVGAAVAVTCPAGSMTIHHARLLHGSAVNRSGRQRRLLLYELAAADAWPLLGKSHFDDLGATAFNDWFAGMMVAGRPTMRWRMREAPVRVPFPDAYPGATSNDGTIYKAQKFLPNRYFDDGEA